jgi:hypothetical protein
MRTATPVPALVRPETHYLAELTKWTLRVVLLLGLLLTLERQAAAAPEVFTASGSFDDGSELSGTITIDTDSGKVLSANVTLATFYQGKIDLTASPYGTTHGYGKYTTTIIFDGGINGRIVDSQLTLPVSTLIDFEGGKIESGPAAHGASSYEIYGSGTHSEPINLATGSLKSTETEAASD